jgi:hypothetical protein
MLPPLSTVLMHLLAAALASYFLSTYKLGLPDRKDASHGYICQVPAHGTRDSSHDRLLISVAE